MLSHKIHKMKLIYIKGVNEYPEIKSESNDLSTILFDIKKYNGNIQDFVDQLADVEFDGIIIPTDLDSSSNYLGLEVSLRIRLSKSKLANKSLVSIFILHSQSAVDIFKNQISNNTNTTASVLFTKGVFMFDSAFALKLLIDKKDNYNVLNTENYTSGFLDVIQIKQSPEFGNHSIANIWGAMQLANVTGNSTAIDSIVHTNQELKRRRTDLFFMYIAAQANLTQSSHAKAKINSTSKNILFIDDEADKGWENVLREIFDGASFESVNFGANFIEECEKKALQKKANNIPMWDLVILDLRLDETEDQGINAYKLASEYSGAKLLRRIKKENPGIQVIMFTATNKAWNIQKLTELGSDGFYIKESPEYKFDNKFSMDNYLNFERQVNICFDNDYLKEIHSYCQSIRLDFSKNPLLKYFPGGLIQLKGLQYQNLILNELDTILEILNSNNANRFNHCVLMQFKILECLSEIFIVKGESLDLVFWDNDLVKFYSTNRTLLNRTDNVLIKNTQERIPKFWYESVENRIHCLLSQKLAFSLTDPIHNSIRSLTTYRNKFIHPNDRMNLSPLSKNDVRNWMSAIQIIISKL